MFLMTYTYIEAKSNYHRGSILILRSVHRCNISAQSSIGMGAVINATFGSIIEIILYGMALIQGKGHLVEGSIVGSLLAGVLLMPGMSMCSGALRRKEQKFNAKSAGVTSMMLIMAIIGALAPTLFYQTYGNVWNCMSFFFCH